MTGIRKKLLILLLTTILIVVAMSAGAAVYRYKKDGVWHFTDDPAAMPDDPRTEAAPREAAADTGQTDLKARLINTQQPANAIENATLATVIVESTFGTGSGFFITTDGYIITNRHVIRPMAGSGPMNDSALSAEQSAIEHFAQKIDDRHRHLQAMQADLTEFRRFLDSHPYSASRQYNEGRYRKAMARYNAMAAELDSARQRLASQRAAMARKRMDASVAALNRNFTVRLVDNTPLYAYVVEVSDDLDIALLKVDGYVTPCLRPQTAGALAQGDPVYAIGNPVKLHHSVTSGIVSGFEGHFIKTNAQIYPGNSGGPLITPSGQVIGVTTFKRITHKFEGLGFAIAIDAVLRALDAV